MAIRLAILAGLASLAGCHSQPGVALRDNASEQALDAVEANIAEGDGKGERHRPMLNPSLGQRMNAAKTTPH